MPLRRLSRRSFVRGLVAAPAIIGLSDFVSGFVGYDEILQIGDSNSYAGLNIDGSNCYDPAIDTTSPVCCEWRTDNHQATNFFFTTICDYYHPLDYEVAIVASAVGGVGPGESFVQPWATNFMAPHRKVRISVSGVGGTGLCNTTNTTSSPAAWQVTPVLGSLVAPAIVKINAALAQSSLNKLVAILWTSGANDAIFEKSTGLSTATYQTAFEALATYLRANIIGTGASTAPILIQPLVPAFVTNPGTACPNTNLALSTMPSVVSQCGYADPSAPGMSGNILGQTAVPYHLSGPSQRLIGSIGFVNAYNNRSA
jgi:hypothetical protein